MAYNFNFVSPTKADAIREIKQRLDAIGKEQPEHKDSKAFALAAAHGYLGLLADPTETEELAIAMDASVKQSEDGKTNWVSFHVSGMVQPNGEPAPVPAPEPEQAE